jgi:hypothetical protein
MAEREPAGRVGADQRAVDELLERRRRIFELGDARRQRQVERVAGDRRGVEQHPGRRRQRVELGGEGGDNAIRDPFEVKAVACRTVPARELLEVERVAAAVGVDRFRRRSHELRRLLLVQRPRHDARERAVAHGRGNRRGERPRRLPFAYGEGDEHAGLGRPAQQPREGVD